MTVPVILMGAAGRDFHNFLTYFKQKPRFQVVAFTAEQIPGISGRRFPASLAGRRYPKGIPILPESKLAELIRRHQVEVVCLAYSDLAHQQVMEKASRVLAAGARFLLLGAHDTCVAAKRPVIAITAVRTGCGKSQTARAVADVLRRRGKKVVAIRHSMPYGDLEKQACQRFATVTDFKKHKTTIEEEEEYQPWLDHGFVVYSGFDYKAIVGRAQREADVLVFDGGNNDLPLVRPDLHITVADPHRAGHELLYYPGHVNFLSADVVVLNKVDSAPASAVREVEGNARRLNPDAVIIRARSDLVVDHPELIRGKRCAVLGDGPTLTHGGMSFGAGTLAVKAHGGRMVNPRKALVGSLKDTYAKYPHLTDEIPAMGYDRTQIRELRDTLAGIRCDVIVDGSPADLERILRLDKPFVGVGYELGRAAVRRLEGLLEERGFIQ